MNSQAQSPLVTVIMPTRNEADFIDRCLKSVCTAESVPGGLEVLIVDAMSTDGTRSILKRWQEQHRNIRVLDNPLKIVPAAMNIGIRAARGEWIVRLDAHSEYPRNYFRLCLETAQQTGADNVGGSVVTLVQDDKWQGNIVRALTTHWFGVGNSAFRTASSPGWVDTVPFGSYRREIFARIGHYDERLVRNQDYEINRRLIRSGGRIWFNPAIQIKYYNQSSVLGLFRQAFNTGKWNPWMWFIAPYTFAWRHAIPLLFATILFLATLLSVVRPILGCFLVLFVLLPYSAVAIWASAEQCRRFGWSLFLLLPGCFFLYHFIYGSGALWGIALLVAKRSPVQLFSQAPRAPVDSESACEPNRPLD
jgi:glycosyltransferase involved in cell wall biosynthesis